MNLLPSECANATIRFISSEFSTDRDPITGNFLPSSTSTAVFQADVYLKFDQNPVNQSLPGIDSQSIFVKGFLIDPMVFPDWVNTGTAFDCSFSFLGQSARSGKLTIHTLPNEMPDYLTDIYGHRFQGLLMLGSAN
jgi:hypothetical protein